MAGQTGDRRSVEASNDREKLTTPYYVLRNPFDKWGEDHMKRRSKEYVVGKGLEDYERYFVNGGLLNLSVGAFSKDREDGLKINDQERRALERESKHRWALFSQSGTLYKLVILCSAAAAVQGWDESAVNGAQVYYSKALSISPESFRYGLVNSAPYLCCTLSCLLTYPLNRYLGRRGAIFVTCLISFLSCLGQAFVQSWQGLLAARLILGIGIGPKSATVPIYSAECAPANVRGALVMMWQVWTAFGILLGYASGMLLYNVGGSGAHLDPKIDPLTNELTLNHSCDGSTSPSHLLKLHCSWNWRLMLASPMILPIIVAAYVLLLPESPRWLLNRAHKAQDEVTRKRYYNEAFQALVKLRPTKLQAARDCFLLDYELQEFEKIHGQQHGIFREFWEESRKFFFKERRSRRALMASVTCMFFQQGSLHSELHFCGVNVIAYYSTTILLRAGYDPNHALAASLGFGAINFVFALPAFWTIDTFGRRSLLLSTFPFLALFHLMVALGFGIGDQSPTTSVRNGVVITGMYLFGIVYSPGEGPVPFVYSAESMPLYNRDIGMGIATAINWFFNFFVSVTWPLFVGAFKEFGAFTWYAAWCMIGELVILLVVPETKGLTLEQLTKVFEMTTHEHAVLGLQQAKAVLMFRWSEIPSARKYEDDREIEMFEYGDVRH